MIKIFDESTYPNDILQIRDQVYALPINIKNEIMETEHIRDYIYREINKVSIIQNIYKTLIAKLDSYCLMLYHNTRVLDCSTFRDNGIIFSNNKRLNILKGSMEKLNIDSDSINKIMDLIVQEINRHGSNGDNSRVNEICFYFDINAFKEFDKYLALFGGELLIYALDGKIDKELYKRIMKIGLPYIIVFSLPFKSLGKYIKEDIARYMIEDWIHLNILKDETNHLYRGKSEIEIPSKDIIEICEIKDSFKEIDDYYF